MSDMIDNVEVMRRGYDAFAEGGVDGFLEAIHPEFELVVPPGLALEPQTYRGHEGVRRYFDSFYDAVDEIRLEAHEFIVEASMEAVQVWAFRDGKAVHADIYPTLKKAREAVG